MLVYVRKILLNDDDPNFKFIRVQVVINEDHDDQITPNNEARVEIFLEKEDQMTRPEIIDAAIQKARQFITEIAVVFHSGEYRRR